MDVNVTTFGPKAHGVTPLHLAAQGGHIKVMVELLERGANIDARTKGACGCKIYFLKYCLLLKIVVSFCCTVLLYLEEL